MDIHTARCVINVDVGIAGICTVVVYKAHGHMHVKYANVFTMYFHI